MDTRTDSDIPKGFIQVPITDGNVLISIQAIVSIYSRRDGGTIIHLMRSETAVGTAYSYKQVLALIKEAQQ